jgi:hypothetical protein
MKDINFSLILSIPKILQTIFKISEKVPEKTGTFILKNKKSSYIKIN